MSPEQLRNKFPWINTEGVALASYGKTRLQRGSGVEGCLRSEVPAPCNHIEEQCLLLASRASLRPHYLSVLPLDLTLVHSVSMTFPG